MRRRTSKGNLNFPVSCQSGHLDAKLTVVQGSGLINEKWLLLDVGRRISCLSLRWSFRELARNNPREEWHQLGTTHLSNPVEIVLLVIIRFVLIFLSHGCFNTSRNKAIFLPGVTRGRLSPCKGRHCILGRENSSDGAHTETARNFRY